MNWREKAACVGLDITLFYPPKGNTTYGAKRVCARCPVRSQCLTEAMNHQERFGVWGGLSERERRRLERMSA